MLIDNINGLFIRYYTDYTEMYGWGAAIYFFEENKPGARKLDVETVKQDDGSFKVVLRDVDEDMLIYTLGKLTFFEQSKMDGICMLIDTEDGHEMKLETSGRIGEALIMKRWDNE